MFRSRSRDPGSFRLDIPRLLENPGSGGKKEPMEDVGVGGPPHVSRACRSPAGRGRPAGLSGKVTSGRHPH